MLRLVAAYCIDKLFRFNSIACNSNLKLETWCVCVHNCYLTCELGTIQLLYTFDFDGIELLECSISLSISFIV